MDVCECVHGMNSQNIYWRIESLHQRTLIRILYEFLSYDYNKCFLDAVLFFLLTFSKVHKRQRTASRILILKSMSMYFIYLQSCTTTSFFLNVNHVFLKRGCLFIILRGDTRIMDSRKTKRRDVCT